MTMSKQWGSTFKSVHCYGYIITERKTEQLNALNIELNLNEKDTPVIDDDPELDEETPEKKNTDRER